MSSNRRMGDVYRELLDDLFDGALTTRLYVLDEETPKWSASDLARIVFPQSYPFYTFPRIPTDKPLIYSSLSFRKKGLDRLSRFPKGTQALLVSTSYQQAMNAMYLLHANQVNNIEFFPCFPGGPAYPDISLAVTPGEPQLAPEGITKVINIGDRVPDVQSMIDIAAHTGLERMLAKKRFREYDASVSGSVRNVASPILRSSRLKQEYDTVINMIEIGIIGIDEKNIIYACNRKAEFLLGKKRSDILYLNAADILPEIPARLSDGAVTFYYERQGSLALNITVTPMSQDDAYSGAMIMLLPAGEDETFKHHLVEKFIQKGHRARYTFEAIIGRSRAISDTISLAKKFSAAASPVLLTGESGTGKEMFAQSIHNASPRFNKPFVAVNCAAIPDDLLESELFGYEGGSFTGARKQGKTGLFEAANRGTIFLDEIGDLSPALQAKLLRAIQERQIMRVGGDAVIPVDARIISAANQNLPKRVSDGSFRRDLYYRISTLPIDLPPLRKRGEDIFLILDAFREELGASFTLSLETKQILASYSWPGNIRELRNCVEYLHCLKIKLIEPSQLPPYLAITESALCVVDSVDEPPSPAVIAIASILRSKPLGRMALSRRLASRGFTLTEAQVRGLLHTMKTQGWIDSPRGRGGSSLTRAGKDALLQG